MFLALVYSHAACYVCRQKCNDFYLIVRHNILRSKFVHSGTHDQLGKKGKKSRYNFRAWCWKICEILVLVNDVHVRRPVSFTMYTVRKSTVKTLVHRTSVDF